MNIVSWNCAGALRKKHHLIDQLDPDLVVVQECEDPSRSTRSYREWAGDYLWRGESKNKGIGVFDRKGVGLQRLDWDEDCLQFFLPCAIGDRFTLLGVWTKYANSPNFRYIGQLWKYLQMHKERIAAGPFMLCGDLNSNKCWDEWDRWWNHSDVVREFEEIGVRSLYHHQFGECQGEETQPTLYHLRKREKPYHVDYIFGSSDFMSDFSLEVGNADPWLLHSDHMPLVLTTGSR